MNEEDDSGVVSEQSAELPEAETLLKEERKKKKKKAGKEEKTAETPVIMSPDVPVKKKSERLYD